MTAIARFGAVSLDSRDPHHLGQFYRAMLDFGVRYESDELVVLQGDGVVLTIELVANHQPPDWPGDRVPKQMHLDLFVDELDTAEKAAIKCGAAKADHQPAPDRWRVLIDPSGHPFCLTVASGAAG
jgi:catechol-2,3-dioxygenase